MSSFRKFVRDILGESFPKELCFIISQYTEHMYTWKTIFKSPTNEYENMTQNENNLLFYCGKDAKIVYFTDSDTINSTDFIGHNRDIRQVIQLTCGKIITLSTNEIKAWNYKTGICTRTIEENYYTRLYCLKDGAFAKYDYNTVNILDRDLNIIFKWNFHGYNLDFIDEEQVFIYNCQQIFTPYEKEICKGSGKIVSFCKYNECYYVARNKEVEIWNDKDELMSKICLSSDQKITVLSNNKLFFSDDYLCAFKVKSDGIVTVSICNNGVLCVKYKDKIIIFGDTTLDVYYLSDDYILTHDNTSNSSAIYDLEGTVVDNFYSECTIPLSNGLIAYIDFKGYLNIRE